MLIARRVLRSRRALRRVALRGVSTASVNPAAAAAAAATSSSGSASASASANAEGDIITRWFSWGGGCDLKFALSRVWGTGGLKKSEDPTFSRVAREFVPSSQTADGQPDVPALSIKQIAYGINHTGIVSTDGSVYVMGINRRNHTLGLNAPANKVIRVPVRLEGLPPIKQLALGHFHSVALAEDGSVYTWGVGGNALTGGALGQGTWADSPTPAQIRVNGFDKQKIAHISAGYHHALAVNADGQVFAWGQGDFGRLGLGDSASARAPMLIEALRKEKIVKAVCGSLFSSALTDKGQLYTWGRNDAGQLGHIGGLMTVDMYNLESLPVLIDPSHFGGQAVAQVACGERHMLVTTKNDRLYQWGNQRHTTPQLLLGENESLKRHRFVAVAAGAAFSACVDALGHVYTWGDNASNCMSHSDSARWLNRIGLTPQPRRVPGFGPETYKTQKANNPFGRAVALSANFRKIAVQSATVDHTRRDAARWEAMTDVERMAYLKA